MSAYSYKISYDYYYNKYSYFLYFLIIQVNDDFNLNPSGYKNPFILCILLEL